MGLSSAKERGLGFKHLCWHQSKANTTPHLKRYLTYFFTGDTSEVNDAQSVCDEFYHSVSSILPLSVSVSCSPSKGSGGGTKSHVILWSCILHFEAGNCTV